MNKIKIAVFYAIFVCFINTYAGDGIGSDFGKNAAEKLCDTVDKNANKLSDAAEKLSSSADKLGDAAKTFGVCISAAYVGIKVVELGRDGYAYCYPSEEKKNSEAKAAQEYKFLVAKREFRECLVKNGKEKRDHAGIPIFCTDQACNLAIAGGEADLESITKTFNKYYTQDKDL